MDSACYCTTDNVIVGVRGGRVFKIDASAGTISSQADFAQPGFGQATCCYDSGTNRVFAAVWDTPVFTNDSPSNTSSPRKVYRIVPSTLVTDLVIDINTTLGITNGALAYTQLGVSDLRSHGGYIYGRIFKNSGGVVNPTMGGFRFLATTPATNDKFYDTTAGFPRCAYGSVGGHDVLFVTDQQEQGFNWYDFNTATFTNGPMEPDATKIMMAIEYAPSQNHVLVTDQAQFIYVYSSVGAFIATINTGRSAFNGVGLRYNSVDGLVYAAGMGDNSVIVVNPATNGFAVKTGFDLPCDFVFTPSKKWAVQQGSTPLKEIT